MTPTSSVLVAEVGEPPNVAQPYREPDTRQQEVELVRPCLSLPESQILFRSGWFVHI